MNADQALNALRQGGLATKADIAELRTATKADIAELRTADIGELKAQIARIDGKLTLLIAFNIAMLLAAVGPYLAKFFGR